MQKAELAPQEFFFEKLQTTAGSSLRYEGRNRKREGFGEVNIKMKNLKILSGRV